MRGAAAKYLKTWPPRPQSRRLGPQCASASEAAENRACRTVKAWRSGRGPGRGKVGHPDRVPRARRALKKRAARACSPAHPDPLFGATLGGNRKAFCSYYSRFSGTAASWTSPRRMPRRGIAARRGAGRAHDRGLALAGRRLREGRAAPGLHARVHAALIPSALAGEDHLHVPELALGEARLAVAEVELPQADEVIRIAQRRELRAGCP